MEDIKDKVTYKFERHATHTDGSVYTDMKVVTDEDYAKGWHDVLREFTMWLGSVYGYDISRSITVQGEPLDEYNHADRLDAILSKAFGVTEDFDCGRDDCDEDLQSRQDAPGATK